MFYHSVSLQPASHHASSLPLTPRSNPNDVPFTSDAEVPLPHFPASLLLRLWCHTVARAISTLRFRASDADLVRLRARVGLWTSKATAGSLGVLFDAEAIQAIGVRELQGADQIGGFIVANAFVPSVAARVVLWDVGGADDAGRFGFCCLKLNLAGLLV